MLILPSDYLPPPFPDIDLAEQGFRIGEKDSCRQIQEDAILKTSSKMDSEIQNPPELLFEFVSELDMRVSVLSPQVRNLQGR
jgi:hypothetical protein